VLEAQQATERRLAVIETQQRIARDVHDLLGHSLTVIAMQAEGARAILATDPAAADEARTLGLTPLILGDALEGEAAQMGTVLAGLLFGARRAGGTAMQAAPGTHIKIVLVLQSTIVLFIAAPPLIRAIFRLPARRAPPRGAGLPQHARPAVGCT